MPPPTSYFCDTEADARELFLAQCSRAGIGVDSVRAGTDAETPHFCDIARLGAPNAENVLVLVSGASGSASFVNAGICTAVIAEKVYADLPRRTAILLLHAPLSHGEAWPAIDTLPGPALESAGSSGRRWDDALLNAADDRYRTGATQSLDGDAPPVPVQPRQAAWSRRDVSDIAKRYLRGFRRVHLIDFRTWQGAWAEPSVKTATAADGIGLTRASLADRHRSAGLSSNRGGEPDGAGFSVYVGPVETGLTVVKFGTFPGTVPFGAMTRQDALPRRYPKDPGWRRQCWEHARRIILQTLVPVSPTVARVRGSRAPTV